MKMKHFSSFYSLTLLLLAQPGQAHDLQFKPLHNGDDALIAQAMEQNSLEDSFVDLSKNRSKLAEITATISSWDEDANSPLVQLNKYIRDGNSIALKETVLEVLAYAESVVAEQAHKRSPDQLDAIDNVLPLPIQHMQELLKQFLSTQ